MTDNTSKEDCIREPAYLIWLEEPDGREKEHWELAERTVNRMDELAREHGRGDSAAAGAPLGPGQA